MIELNAIICLNNVYDIPIVFSNHTILFVKIPLCEITIKINNINHWVYSPTFLLINQGL